jgi:protein disulfide-isomerase
MPRRLFACLALCLSVVSLSAAEGWLTDLDEGIKVAKAEKKAILVDFTGSDWCGWCIRLKKEVFDQKEFAAVSKDFVLVELDEDEEAEPRREGQEQGLGREVRDRRLSDDHAAQCER